MKMPKIAEKYNSISRKYKLPSFKELDNEFEISSIEDSDFLLRSIISKMNDKMEFFINSLGEILNPDASNVYSLHEYRFVNDEERKNLFEIYKKLVSFSRYSIETSLMSDEKEEASFIKSFHQHWISVKPGLLKFYRGLRESWDKEPDTKEEVGYMG